MTEKKSVSYFILVDNMINIVKYKIRACTGELDSNSKYDPSANLFATYCPKCQG